MKTKKWKSSEKLRIVLDGLSSKITIAELCNKYEINQSQFYRWKDTLLTNADKIFDSQSTEKQILKADRENKRLKNIIGELTVELKKTELGIL